MQNLNTVFRPQSVALIGASRDPDSMSGVLLRNLRQSFSGPIYPVNPHADEIEGLSVFHSVAEIPGSVDLAFVSVPAALVRRVSEECAATGVKAIILITAGFSETGETGTRRQAELLELVRETGIVLVGPNCMGVINTDPECPLNGSFGLAFPDRGNVAICTQSGALGFVFPDYIHQWSTGVSSFASVGNKMVVGENQLLKYWADDPATEVIQLYLESFQDPVEFRRIAAAITPHKPILVLKSGRTETGRRAASSHTAALASRDAAVDALFKQTGVIRADTLQELFELTAVLASQPLPQGRRVAVLTDAGGPGILCVDVLEASGLKVPVLSPALQNTLREFLKPAVAVSNPIDLIGSADPDEFRRCLRYLLESNEVDSVIVIYVARLPETSAHVARAVRETAEMFADDKVVLGVFMQSAGQPQELMTSDYRIPSFLYPESAARALAESVHFAEWRSEPMGTVRSFEDVDLEAARELIRNPASNGQQADGWLDPVSVDRLLNLFGLTTPKSELVTSLDSAVAAFTRIDGPVAMKVVAPGVLHKSDVGGVTIDVRTEEDVVRSFKAMMTSIQGAQGVLVQEFIGAGQEIMIGMVRDNQFGPQIAFSAGGTIVEFLEDVALRLAPLTDRDIECMISETKTGRLLTRGHRDRTPRDVAAVRDVLARVSFMAEHLSEIVELDFNPIKVLSPGEGLWIVDARVRAREAPGGHGVAGVEE